MFQKQTGNSVKHLGATFEFKFLTMFWDNYGIVILLKRLDQ